MMFDMINFLAFFLRSCSKAIFMEIHWHIKVLFFVLGASIFKSMAIETSLFGFQAFNFKSHLETFKLLEVLVCVSDFDIQVFGN